MTTTVQARMKCTKADAKDWGTQVSLEAAYSDNPNDPNHSYSVATPCGRVDLTITNKAAADAFAVGSFYLIDFRPAP